MDKFVCISCGQEKDQNQFYKKWRGREYYSKECCDCTKKRTKQQRDRIRSDPALLEESRRKARERQKEYRKRRTEEQKKQSLESQYSFVEKRREWIESLKTNCAKCGESRKYLIHWHHIDPSQKEFAISSGCTQAKHRILEETKKCVCLCANCHTEFHHFYGQKPSDPVKSLSEYLGKMNGGEENA